MLRKKEGKLGHKVLQAETPIYDRLETHRGDGFKQIKYFLERWMNKPEDSDRHCERVQ
jgi:hypothetical protein